MTNTKTTNREQLLSLISNKIQSCRVVGPHQNARFYALQYAWDFVSIKDEGSSIHITNDLWQVINNEE